jgi:hypothetical protein
MEHLVHRHSREGASPASRATLSRGALLDRAIRRRGAKRLRADHPMTAALLGESRFGTAAQQYARWARSRGPGADSESRSFSSFLRQLQSLPRPDLPDLAALERARAEVARERPPSPVGREALAAIATADLTASRLHLVSSLRVVVLEHDAVALWRRLRSGLEPEHPEPMPTVAVVWQDCLDVLHARLDLDEALALEAVLAGDPFARVFAAFGRAVDPAGTAFATLESWFDEGWIAGVVPPRGTVGAAA